MSSLAYDIICYLCHMSAMTMTYDINNICWYGCLKNRQDLSYSAPGFKVTQKVSFMPKNWKTKIWIFPLYFHEFSFINLSEKYVQKCDLSEHFRILQTQQKCLRIVKNIFSEGAIHFSRIFYSMAPLTATPYPIESTKSGLW